MGSGGFRFESSYGTYGLRVSGFEGALVERLGDKYFSIGIRALFCGIRKDGKVRRKHSELAVGLSLGVILKLFSVRGCTRR